MSTARRAGPSEDEWAFFREQLTRWYSRDNKSLTEVMSLMEDNFGFVAKKHQYEKYLNHKWRLSKNTKSTTWKAIAPIIHDLYQRGRPFELWIDNEKKSSQTIRKEMRRYTGAGKVSLKCASSGKLPSGVVIRESTTPRRLLVVDQLPFNSFEKHLDFSLPIRNARNMHKNSLPTSTIRTEQAKPFDLDNKCAEALQVVSLEANDLALPLRYIQTFSDLHAFQFPLHRKLLFSLANNFAGLHSSSTATISRVTHQAMKEISLAMPPSLTSYFSFHAIARSLYIASIRNGDAKIVNLLLSKSIPSVKANTLFRDAANDRKTPFELALILGYDDVVKVLLKHGADPKFAPPSRSCKSLGSALFRRIHNLQRRRIPDLTSEFSELLLASGVEVHTEDLQSIIRCHRSKHLVSVILSRDAARRHKEWMSQGIFHGIFKFQDSIITLQAVSIMIQYNLDLNLEHRRSFGDRCYSCDIFTDIPSSSKYLLFDPYTFVDLAAMRGDIMAFKLLVANGAIITGDTLLRATIGGCEPLLQWALGHDKKTALTEWQQDEAMAAAIYLNNPQILSLVDSRSTAMNKISFNSSMAAASRTGNWTLFQQFYASHLEVMKKKLSSKLYNEFEDWESMISLKSALEIALACSIRDGEDSTALKLLDAGVCPHRAEFNRPHVNSVERTLAYESLCSLGYSIEQPESPLNEALKRQNTTMVNSILDAGGFKVRPSKRPSLGSLPLSYAVNWGDVTILRSMIAAGHVRNDDASLEAFGIIIARKDKVMLDMLLNAGVSINLRFRSSAYREEGSALLYAVRSEDLDMVEHVLALGADPHDVYALAEASRKQSVTLDLLLRRHAQVYPKGCKGWGGDILVDAIAACNLDLVKKMTNAGADANEIIWKEEHLNTLPEVDVDLGDPIESGNSAPRPTRYSNYIERKSAFGCAITRSESVGIEFADYFLQESTRTGCKPESFAYQLTSSSDIRRETAFLVAIKTLSTTVVELLIRHNADVNFPARLSVRHTPLQLAVEEGSLGIVQLLLNHGADVNGAPARNRGATALQIASMKRYIRIALLLLEHGADVHAPGSKIDGRTALEGASEHGRLDTVALLLQRYGKYETQHEEEFERAITYAQRNGFDYIAELLRQHQSAASTEFSEFFDFGPSEDETVT